MLTDEKLLQAIETRHSVRAYRSETIPVNLRAALQDEIDHANGVGKLHLQAVYDEPQAFSSWTAHYGKFSNVSNYLVCAGKPGPGLEERVGYHGQRIVLAAQALGLNTCWVALTYGKGAARRAVAPGEKLVCVIAFGFGTTPGSQRKSKAVDELGCSANGPLPPWFETSLRAVQLAPTAMNQQKFRFELKPNGSVEARNLGGFYSKIDLGIARLHFELAAHATEADWTWA